MKTIGAIFALLTVALYYRPKTAAMAILFWIPKLITGALAPMQVIVGLLVAINGLIKRQRRLAGAGLATATLNVMHIAKVTQDRTSLFDEAFGTSWREETPTTLRQRFFPSPWQPFRPDPVDVIWQRDLVVGEKFQGGPLLADLWEPRPGDWRSGLAILYTHGGAWRYGNKDMMTRSQFRHFAHQGHVVLDLEYSIGENTPIEAMVKETKQALLWLKTHASDYGINPDKIVLMGGSAGAHLALLAAYTPGHAAFQPDHVRGDEHVCGVVAFYPPVDFFEMYRQSVRHVHIDNQTPWMMPMVWSMYLLLKWLGFADDLSQLTSQNNFLTRLLGGTPAQAPERYRLLSPINHVAPTCPPTLILIGEDDFFGFLPGAQALHQALRRVGAPSVLLSFPHTDHAFDLVLPQVSPVAQSAIFHVERFLAALLTRNHDENTNS